MMMILMAAFVDWLGRSAQALQAERFRRLCTCQDCWKFFELSKMNS
jgi:hypothetical protein